MLTSLYLKVLFWLSVATWALLLVVNGQPVTAALFKPSSLVLSGMILLVTFFEKWGWRWSKLHPWFVGIPNLVGTYAGGINSHWTDPATGRRPNAIPAYMVVRQTLSTIHVRVYTTESESCSVIGSFLKSHDGKLELLYTYRNESRLEVRQRSPIHYGGTRLSIDQKAERLQGSYWTDRQTVGELDFTRISRATSNSFAEGEALHGKEHVRSGSGGSV